MLSRASRSNLGAYSRSLLGVRGGYGIDFIVDLFDRNDDADSLGSYWNPDDYLGEYLSSHAWGILDGKAVLLRSLPFLYNRYFKKLSSKNYNLRADYALTIEDMEEYIAQFPSSSLGEPFGLFACLLRHWININYYVVFVPVIDTYWPVTYHVELDYYISVGSSYVTWHTTLEEGVYSGSILISVIDDEVTIVLGERTDVFTTAQIKDEAAPMIGCGYWTPYYPYPKNTFDNVKIWIDGIPEPPGSESGHGNYRPTSGFSYTDKYHSGGIYNPNA
jgi:hypothetical protein